VISGAALGCGDPDSCAHSRCRSEGLLAPLALRGGLALPLPLCLRSARVRDTLVFIWVGLGGAWGRSLGRVQCLPPPILFAGTDYTRFMLAASCVFSMQQQVGGELAPLNVAVLASTISAFKPTHGHSPCKRGPAHASFHTILYVSWIGIAGQAVHGSWSPAPHASP
jgi:hypothetical protein